MTMSEPRTVTWDEWRLARIELLNEEKDLTRARDELNARRRRLPRVLIDKEYAFEGPNGRVGLLDLFGGCRQLAVYHFMPRFEDGSWCPACSFWIDNVGHLAHLRARDTSLVVVCPEPMADIEPYRRHMGWDVPFVSSRGSDFNEDLNIDLEGAFASDDSHPDDPLTGGLEPPGVSVFVRDGDTVHYTYSTYRRGTDLLNNTYNYLDLTPLGRQEEGLDHPLDWLRHHDDYDDHDGPV